ncbi:hypothetical protein ACWIGM_04640 [Bosea sp. NPDC055332]
MRLRWRLYFTVGLLLFGYAVLGSIASQTPIAPLALKLGETAAVSVLRLNRGPLRMEARIPRNRFPARNAFDQNEPPEGLARLEIEVRPSWQEAVRYTAGRTIAYSATDTARGLVPLAGSGERSASSVVFERGRNRLSLLVTAADPPLLGEQVEIWILPALGAKSSEPGVVWLDGSILLPIYAVPYLIWGAVLLLLQRGTKRGPDK